MGLQRNTFSQRNAEIVVIAGIWKHLRLKKLRGNTKVVGGFKENTRMTFKLSLTLGIHPPWQSCDQHIKVPEGHQILCGSEPACRHVVEQLYLPIKHKYNTSIIKHYALL